MAEAAAGPPWRRLLVVFIVLAVVAVGAGAVWHFQPGFGGADAETAPDFTIQTINNGTFTLSEHRGEVVVLDLMAVDCASCRITEKAIVHLARERPNVTIVSIDIWTQFEDEAYLDQHMRKLNASWPYGMDTDDLFFKYEAWEISKVVVIDADGRITWTKVGGVDYPPVRDAVDGAVAGGGDAERTLGLGLIGFAVFAGLASFFAPCAFPLLPGYMAYTLSLNDAKKEGGERRSRLRDALIPGLAAAGGIILVYGAFGLIVAAFGQAAAPWLPYLQPFVGLLAIILGAALLFGASMDRIMAPLQRGIGRVQRLITGNDSEGTLTGYFSYGLGYGAAAAGCVAPVFLQLTLTAIALGAVTGLKVFAVYAGVAALLMVVATLIAVKARGWLQRRAGAVARTVNRASGVVLVAAGIYLLWFFNRGFGLPGFA